jgi:hypothetical protein
LYVKITPTMDTEIYIFIHVQIMEDEQNKY